MIIVRYVSFLVIDFAYDCSCTIYGTISSATLLQLSLNVFSDL